MFTHLTAREGREMTLIPHLPGLIYQEATCKGMGANIKVVDAK